jgi:hypothetical protein
MFSSSSCPACLAQIKILGDHFKGKNANIVYYDLDKYPPPSYILDRDGSYSMPTWVFPNGTIHKGLIKDKKKIGSLVSRNSRFGAECLNTDYSVPDINSLARCGKNFPDYKGLQIPKSFMENVESVWGKGSDVLNAGVGGTRSLGPDNIGEMYSNNFYNNIRMAQPSDQLGTALYLNRQCNVINGDNTYNTKGMIYNSENPQIVGFGSRKKKNSFGLYSQMGPAYSKQYIMDPETIRNQYGGGVQNDLPRPQKVNNGDYYIGTFPEYKPIKFGKKVGEGSVLTVKKNKIKVQTR